jgi:hypothetical protein
VSFSEQPPSKQWAALKYRGEKFAEVWFKPECDPLALRFRIRQESFQIAGVGKQLTLENLLKAVAIGPEDVETWRQGDVAHSGKDGSNPELRNAVLPPPPHVTHLDIYVRLKPPPQTVAHIVPVLSPLEEGAGEEKGREPEISPTQWQDLEARWKVILGLEASLDTLRLGMENLLVEMEGSLTKTMTLEEKTYALRADVAQWEGAKKRIRFALPRMKDFIHRSVWALGSPERKRLGELYKDHIQPQVPFPQMEEVSKQLEELQKNRQALSAVGNTVYQDGRSIAAEVQGILRTLKTNAAAQRKKAAAGPKTRR